MAGALTLVGFQLQRIIFNHPDIVVDKYERSSVMRENDDDAETHHEHFLRTQSVARPTTQIMPGQTDDMDDNRRAWHDGAAVGEGSSIVILALIAHHGLSSWFILASLPFRHQRVGHCQQVEVSVSVSPFHLLARHSAAFHHPTPNRIRLFYPPPPHSPALQYRRWEPQRMYMRLDKPSTLSSPFLHTQTERFA